MKNSPKSLDHPSFGQCELVPSLVAIKWAVPTKGEAAKSALSGFTLKLAAEAPKGKRTGRASVAHDPAAATVNHSETLTWASATRLTDAILNRISADPKVHQRAPKEVSDPTSPSTRRC